MLWILAALIAAIVVYVFARPYLIEHWGFWRKFCERVDPFVVSWLSKSRQIALARLTGLSGIVIALASGIGDIPIDWAMIGDLVVKRFPESAQPFVGKIILPLAIWVYGEFMRRVSREPVAAKE
jgi:hypothetical protein